MEAWRVVLSWLVATRTVKDSFAMEVRRSSYGYTKYHKRFLRHGSVKGCSKLVGFIEYHKRFIRHGWVEYFATPRKCGNGSYAMEARRVELSWLATSSTIKVPTSWKRGGLYRVGWMY